MYVFDRITNVTSVQTHVRYVHTEISSVHTIVTCTCILKNMVTH